MPQTSIGGPYVLSMTQQSERYASGVSDCNKLSQKNRKANLNESKQTDSKYNESK